MRILIANESVVGSGGVENYLAAVMPALAAHGHAVAFLHANTRHEGGATRLEAAELIAGVEDEGSDRAFERVRAWRPDVCFSHNMRQMDVEERLLATWPVVKMMHGYFGTCVSSQKAHAFPSTVPCTRTFGGACLALYLPRHCGRYRPLAMMQEYRTQSRQNALLTRYASIVTASRHMADEYIRHGAARVVAAPLFATERYSGPPRDLPATPTVLFVGRMTAIKGGEILLRALAVAAERLPQPVRLIMAGGGPERAALEALARKLGVDATFPGWVTGDARTALFRAASVVAVPSLWPEPFGLVGLEAAVHGVPAVAFDVGGIGEWLRDAVNGVLIRDRGSIAAMGEALATLLDNRGELARLGEGAVRAAGELSLEAHMATIERVLAGATSRARATA